MSHTTYSPADLTTFCRLDELGLTASGQRLYPDRTELLCRVTGDDPWCRSCGAAGLPRDSVVRRLAHEPFGWRPTTLVVRIRRYRCPLCAKVWQQDTTGMAAPRAKLSRSAIAWALNGLVCQHLTVARIAQCLGVSWNTANTAVLAEGQRRLINDPHRFDGVKVIGVDEHVWRHTARGDRYVTVIIDLTPVQQGTGSSRLLDMVEGRSKAVFKNWLAGRSPAFRQGIEVVAMDGFTGFKTAAAEELPDAVAVMDPFHVVRLAADALDGCRRRVQQETLGRRGRKEDPLYRARRTLLTGEEFLTPKQQARLEQLFADEAHAQVKTAWESYQQMVSAYREADRVQGKRVIRGLIDTVVAKLPESLVEVRKLVTTLKRRASDILAYFDRPGTSNGPTEAINGRLEHLRGSALGFRNLTHYIARSLLESGGFRPKVHPQL